MVQRQKALRWVWAIDLTKMRQIYIAILTLLILAGGCTSADAPDCIQAAGDLVTKQFDLGEFDRIRIEDGVRMVVRQGDEREVVLESGEFLIDDISVSIDGDVLVVGSNNKCNFFREYGLTTVYVTTPELREIRNSSRFEVRSEGVLNFPRLFLFSNTSGEGASGKKSGDFYLTVDVNNLRISANGVSVFYLDGNARNATYIFSDEQPRLEAADLIADNIDITQVSANKMIINPQLSLTGVIRGVGDVIAVNRPEIVEVEELFTGRLIFED